MTISVTVENQIHIIRLDNGKRANSLTREMLDQLREMGHESVITAGQQRKLKKALKRQLVRRSHLFRIVSAWLITVPASALLSALFYFALRGMMV